MIETKTANRQIKSSDMPHLTIKDFDCGAVSAACVRWPFYNFCGSEAEITGPASYTCN